MHQAPGLSAPPHRGGEAIITHLMQLTFLFAGDLNRVTGGPGRSHPAPVRRGSERKGTWVAQHQSVWTVK
jgi:hypothetical protein